MKTPNFGYETRSKMKRMQSQGNVMPKKKRKVNKSTSKENIASPKQKPLTDKFISLSEWLAIHV